MKVNSKKREDRLIKVIQGEDKKKADKAWLELYELLHPLIYSIASRYLSGGTKDKMLISAGKKGLRKAMITYDASKKYKFSTYSTWFIRKEIHLLLGIPVDGDLRK